MRLDTLSPVLRAKARQSESQDKGTNQGNVSVMIHVAAGQREKAEC